MSIIGCHDWRQCLSVGFHCSKIRLRCLTGSIQVHRFLIFPTVHHHHSSSVTHMRVKCKIKQIPAVHIQFIRMLCDQSLPCRTLHKMYCSHILKSYIECVPNLFAFDNLCTLHLT